jgi:hypothetical protein
MSKTITLAKGESERPRAWVPKPCPVALALALVDCRIAQTTLTELELAGRGLDRPNSRTPHRANGKCLHPADFAVLLWSTSKQGRQHTAEVGCPGHRRRHCPCLLRTVAIRQQRAPKVARMCRLIRCFTVSEGGLEPVERPLDKRVSDILSAKMDPGGPGCTPLLRIGALQERTKPRLILITAQIVSPGCLTRDRRLVAA